MNDAASRSELLDLVAGIVSAHISRNPVATEALPDIIRSVYAAMSSAGIELLPAAKLQPAVPVKRSVFADHIICLEDGKKLKMLKRYLATSYGMTPDEYRQRWGLPHDYPMVAPNYAATRSDLAKKIGLGRKASVPKEPSLPPVRRVAEGVRGRRLPKAATG